MIHGVVVLKKHPATLLAILKLVRTLYQEYGEHLPQQDRDLITSAVQEWEGIFKNDVVVAPLQIHHEACSCTGSDSPHICTYSHCPHGMGVDRKTVQVIVLPEGTLKYSDERRG